MGQFVGGFILGFGCGCYYMANKLELEEPTKTIAGFMADDVNKGYTTVKEKTVNGVETVKEKFKKQPEPEAKV